MIAAVVVAAQTGLFLVAMPLLLVAATLALRRRGRGWRELGLRWHGIGASSLLLATACAIALAAGGFFVLRPLAELATGSELDLSLFAELRGNAPAWLGMVVLGWTYAAFGEELLFRGFAFDALQRSFAGCRFGRVLAAALQAVAFGLAHGYQGPSGVLLTGLLGFVLAGLYLATGRQLSFVVLTHGLVDTLMFTAFYTEVL